MSELFVVVFNAMFGKNEVRLFRGGVKSLIILSGSTAHGIKSWNLGIIAIIAAILTFINSNGSKYWSRWLRKWIATSTNDWPTRPSMNVGECFAEYWVEWHRADLPACLPAGRWETRQDNKNWGRTQTKTWLSIHLFLSWNSFHFWIKKLLLIRKVKL